MQRVGDWHSLRYRYHKQPLPEASQSPTRHTVVNLRALPQALDPPGQALGLPGRAGPGTGPDWAQGLGLSKLKPARPAKPGLGSKFSWCINHCLYLVQSLSQFAYALLVPPVPCELTRRVPTCSYVSPARPYPADNRRPLCRVSAPLFHKR
jgi:hypothetical protein